MSSGVARIFEWGGGDIVLENFESAIIPVAYPETNLGGGCNLKDDKCNFPEGVITRKRARKIWYFLTKV